MNRVLLGAIAMLVMLGIGLFWIQGRAEVEAGAPPPEAAEATANPDVLPSADTADLVGPAPPEATDLTREQRRFGRYDRNRDGRISRNEMLSARTDGFRKLDRDGNNLLTFEEWAFATAEKFDQADGDHDQWLSTQEFRSTAPPPKPKSRCGC
jgi:hypothetical protein